MKPRSFNQWLRILERAHPRTVDLGLDRVRAVYQYLPDLKENTRVVVVAGTNGKGSCVATMAAMAQRAGVCCGAYTSPHLRRFSERLRIDGVVMEDSAWCAAFERVECARLKAQVSLSFFEFTTLAVLYLLHVRAVDLALLEVGLGGLLDAVNIVDSDVAVVTQIALDHVDYLGTDIEQIASQKAGVFRSGHPAIVADPNPPRAIVEAAESAGAHPYFLGRDFETCAEYSTRHSVTHCWRGVDANGDTVSCSHLPSPQLHKYSVAAAIQAWQLLYNPAHALLCELACVAYNASLEGRRQVLYFEGLKTILDVAHNPAAARDLCCYLNNSCRVGNFARICGVLGMCADKDMVGFVRALSPLVSVWYPVATQDSRSADIGTLADAVCSAGGCVSELRPVDTAGALRASTRLSDKEGVLLVCGSFSVVAESLSWLETQVQTSHPHVETLHVSSAIAVT